MFKGLWGSRWRRAGGDPLGAALGSLEREVMTIVWQGRDLTVREVHGLLSRPVAYTTVMTTLDRLYKKGVVERTRSGRAFIYSAVQTREELEAAVAGGVLRGLMTNGSGAAMPILSNLVDAVGRQDDAVDLLNELERIVREKRERMERERKDAS
jgi:predicted transcriptional regulator